METIKSRDLLVNAVDGFIESEMTLEKKNRNNLLWGKKEKPRSPWFAEQ